MPAAIVGDRPEAVVGEMELLDSQLSEFSGQPWLRTTAGPEPQSL
jgi:hypothetical protein